MAGRYCIPLPELSEKDLKRFLSKYEEGAPNECWLWHGSINEQGYGVISVRNHMWLATRYAYLLHYGDLPTDRFVLHECDNPPCMNWGHLFLGTRGDNIRDCIRKGRYPMGDQSWARLHPELLPRGEKRGHAKLTAEKVILIRAIRAQQGLSFSEIARRFGVSPDLIRGIVKGTRWRHIPL